MYLLNINYDNRKWSWSERLMRTSNHLINNWPNVNSWKYVGLTHEAYINEQRLKDGIAMTHAGVDTQPNSK
jgi:hypothetical protein